MERIFSEICRVKHYNIPIFLPELACPFRCVYCNQFSIAGRQPVPEVGMVRATIEAHLRSFPKEERHVEVAFFGGNFTGLPEAMQDAFLGAVTPYLENGQVQGIRCSTRPDYINKERLKVLKAKGMRHIELGAQSTNDAVLQSCGRGHSFADIKRAAELILAEGFVLGLQMMLGLPGSSHELDLQTARDIVALGATETRIYPCLVVKDTVLEKRYRKGSYKPLSLEDAVQEATDIYDYFVKNAVTVLRIGLHPSDDLDHGDCIAGPYHHNFAEMVYGAWWQRQLARIEGEGCTLKIYTHPLQRTHAIGYQATNRKALSARFQKVEFVEDESVPLFDFRYQTEEKRSATTIIASSLMPEAAKEKLATMGTVLWLEPSDFVYPSIAAHPDIYFFQYADNQLVFAHNTPPHWIAFLHQAGVKLMRGKSWLGWQHPATIAYNACGTSEVLIHDLIHTDPRILQLYEEKTKVPVRQAYTRCNLLALNDKAFITSDQGILRVLREIGKDVLYIDPRQIRLEGHEHGFFPGCCGVFGKQLVFCGNTSLLIEKAALDQFLSGNGFTLFELYDGPLTDLGSIFLLRSQQ